MKTTTSRLSLVLFSAAALTGVARAEPRLHTWFTERSGAYARIFETAADEAAGDAVITWSRGDGVQNLPVYAGIHEISHTDDWIYIRTSNLASYVMGPWYLNAARTNLFPSYPDNQAVLYRFPRNPADPATVLPKQLTGGGPIGYMVNGVSMFDSRDAFSYSVATGRDENGPQGDGAWNRDAWVNEGITFDAGNAHQARGRHHYHANPPGLRHQLGDSVDHDPVANRYTENFNGKHSPILAWVRDGLPVYGPYGYDDPMDPESGVRRMISGYQLRTDIAAIGSARNTWPAWATRIYRALGIPFAAGPSVDGGGAGNTYPLGKYLEDNDYKGDLGMTFGKDFDLNEFNVRFCVTPEFPDGTWAYFVCIDPVGTPVFPYNIGRVFFGAPVGDDATAIPETDEGGAPVTTIFEGGPEAEVKMSGISVDDPDSDEITLVWRGAEGGNYEILESSDLGENDPWTPIGPEVVAAGDTSEIVHDPGGPLSRNFYRVNRTALEAFDTAGFDFDEPIKPLPVGGPVTITVAMSGGPADLQQLPDSLTFNGQTIDVANAGVVRPTRQSISFTVTIFGMAPGDYSVEAQYPTGPLRTGSYRIEESVLLLIVDDWGADNSPLDNATPGVLLPKMPNLAQIAAEGLRFTRAYAQPQCSPTRATILTGRQPFQHEVGSPEQAGQFSAGSGIDEITLPEIFTAMNAPHEMLTVGKWHLGGNLTAYQDRGGWPEFYGINGGGVPSYTNWPKNSNGSSATSTTYTTTDQVNHAAQFIGNSLANGRPFFTWVAFNAPHDPFEDPPADLAPEGGYSPQEPGELDGDWYYRKMLEALDTEMGRLLQVIDPAQTNVVVIGDNGSPITKIQAPYDRDHSKGSLYNGGTHVPLIVRGPSVTVPVGSTSDKLVHCIDLFSTILEMAGIDEGSVPGLPAMNVQSTSLVPILRGTDNADRAVVAELGGGSWGRAIVVDDYPAYKLIIHGDPNTTADSPRFEFFDVANDVNEQTPLAHDPDEPFEINLTTLANLGGDALAAYNACLAKDQALGGGYSTPASNYDTVYIELPTAGVTPQVPGLAQADVASVTVEGNPAVVIGRFDSGASLSDEGDDGADRYWVKVRISPANGGPYNTAEVTFPNNAQGDARVYDSINAILVNPNP